MQNTQRQKPGIHRRKGYVNASTKPSEFYHVAFGRRLYNSLEELQEDLENGWTITIIHEPIKAKCAAGGHQCRHCLMANRSGMKRSDS